MNKADMEVLKLAQLDIMDEIHRVCVNNNISYYMIGGTALGAVRHKGYIPWDIDIDIAMIRADYERFKTVSSTEMNSRYIVRDYENTKDFSHPHALVCIKNTTLCTPFSEFNPKAENLGVYLDVFPLDFAPDDPELQKKQAKRLKMIKFFKYYRVPYTYTSSNFKNMLRAIFRGAFCWISTYKVNELQQKEMQRYNKSKSAYLCSMSSHYAYEKQCMPKEIYGTPVLMEFDGRQYYGPEKVDEYLTRVYGDYMRLPPKSEQKANLEIFSYIQMDR